VELRDAVRRATMTLAEAGVASAPVDALYLAAHLLGQDVRDVRRRMVLGGVEAPDGYDDLVAERARRVPLQHLTGRAYFRHVQLDVGPGVFVPRPETEVMTGWALDQLRPLVFQMQRPLVVELCAGSGAIAKALVDELPRLRVHAVEVSEDAAAWAARNLGGTSVELHVGDMATALPELNGTVDLVIANPPYIPLDAYESVPPEVRDHDPAVALFSGEDGLDAIKVVANVAARLLRPAGFVCVEHADVQGESAVAVLVAGGAFRGVRDHRDLTGRPRFVTAVKR
jgi:release factor glutamine methyltransferase